MRITLITEGVSENRIIKHILNKLFDEEELFFRDAQPQIKNDKQSSSGGWNEVLKYCGRTDDLQEIFNNTDYLIIQIDTDQSQTSPFNISHTKADNSIKTVEELYTDVVAKLRALIDNEILSQHGSKIYFAICIHTIECWLLPLYFNNAHRSDIRNCLTTLNVELRRKDIGNIPTRDKNNLKGVRVYEQILKGWRKKRDIESSAEYNLAFKRFIDSLNNIPTTNEQA